MGHGDYPHTQRGESNESLGKQFPYDDAEV
jgi:hypothetical protein